MMNEFKKGFGSIMGIFAAFFTVGMLEKLAKKGLRALSEYQITKKESK